MMLEGAKTILKVYSSIVLLILATRMLYLAIVEKDTESCVTLAALILVLVYVANM